MLIAHISDLHIRPFGRAANRVVETNMMVERTLRRLLTLHPVPDAVVITGDLTECGLEAEYAEFIRLFQRQLPFPVYVVPGNHDRREAFREALGWLPGVKSDEEFVQYSADIGPIRLIMLDSVVARAGYGELCDKRLAFLDRALADAKGRPVLIGLHHPPLTTGIAGMDKIPLRAPQALLSRAASHGNVLAILCGHHHRAIISQHQGTMILSAPTTGGHQSEVTFDPKSYDYFNLEPGGYFLLRYNAEHGLVSFLDTIGDFPGPYPFAGEPEYPGM